ncbi:MAG: hypothetical protein R8K21_01915 [Mariprofundales bacterium]
MSEESCIVAINQRIRALDDCISALLNEELRTRTNTSALNRRWAKILAKLESQRQHLVMLREQLYQDQLMAVNARLDRGTLELREKIEQKKAIEDVFATVENLLGLLEEIGL